MKELLKRKSVVTTVLVPLAVTLGIVIASSDVVAQESKSYTGITQAVFDTCIKPVAQNKAISQEWFGDVTGWAQYDTGNAGEVRLKSDATLAREPAELNFLYEPDKNNLTYTIKRQNFGVTQGKIWGGFNGTMVKCKGNAN